jgi:hypothetical protein
MAYPITRQYYVIDNYMARAYPTEALYSIHAS